MNQSFDLEFKCHSTDHSAEYFHSGGMTPVTWPGRLLAPWLHSNADGSFTAHRGRAVPLSSNQQPIMSIFPFDSIQFDLIERVQSPTNCIGNARSGRNWISCNIRRRNISNPQKIPLNSSSSRDDDERLIGGRWGGRCGSAREGATWLAVRVGRLIDRPMDQSDRPGGRSTSQSIQVPPGGLDDNSIKIYRPSIKVRESRA